MKNSFMVESFDGLKLFTTRSLTDGMVGIVVLVHGLAEHSGRYSELEVKLNEEQFGVYKFDHRGHGKSEGEKCYYSDFNDLIEDINQIVERAKKSHTELPVYLIGHSMGGFGVACFGTKYPNKVDGIIISGGLTRDNHGISSGVPAELNDHFQLPNELTDGVCSVESVRLDYANDPLNSKTFSAGLIREIGQGVTWLKENTERFIDSVLILHGAEDTLVSYKDSLEFFKEIPAQDKQVKLYGNFFHEIFNEYGKDEVMSDVVNWIKFRIKENSKRNNPVKRC